MVVGVGGVGDNLSCVVRSEWGLANVMVASGYRAEVNMPLDTLT